MPKFHCLHLTESKSKAQRAQLTHPKPADLFTEVEIGVGMQGQAHSRLRKRVPKSRRKETTQ